MYLIKFLQKFVFLIVVMASSNTFAEYEDIEATIFPFFDALKQGNVVAVESYLGDPLLGDVKTLLRDNKAYPNFLRDYYRDVSITIVSIGESKLKDIAIVNIDVYFPAGHIESLQLDLIKLIGSNWKIHNQQAAIER